MPPTAKTIPPATKGENKGLFASFVSRKAVVQVRMRSASAKKGSAFSKGRNSSAPMAAPASEMPPAAPAAATQPSAKGAKPPGVWLAVNAAVRKKRIPFSRSRTVLARSSVIVPVTTACPSKKHVFSIVYRAFPTKPVGKRYVPFSRNFWTFPCSRVMIINCVKER